MTNGKVREWIGPRIVPIFADDVQWDIDSTYEPLMMVQSAGETYMSRQYVPSGIDLPDVESEEIANDYWVHMSNWNAQIEGYRAELQQYIAQVNGFDGRITTNANGIATINGEIGTGFDSTNTISAAIADIIAQIGNGFDSTNTVAKAIDDTLGIIGSGFDSTNTVAKAIDDTNDIIGDGFDSTNTVAKAINDLSNELSGKLITQPAWDIIDRFIINETANSAPDSGSQAGCFFEQENVSYTATMIKTNSATDGVDTIRIRNLSTGTAINFSIPVCHGLSLDYNATTKELMYYDEIEHELVIVSVANIVTPNVSRTISVTDTPLWWGVCWYEDTKIIVYRQVGNQRVCDIYETNPDLEYVETIELSGFEHLQTDTYQDCSYRNGVFAVTVSSPNAIILYELNNGSLINVINLPSHVGHSIIVESEGITITDDSIYIEHPMNVDNVFVVTWIRWNFKHGSLQTDSSIMPWGNEDTIAAYVDWSNGSLIDPLGNSRKFKLFGDFENFVKMNYPNQCATITFQSNYPLFTRITGLPITVNLANYNYPLGMRFSMCPHVIINADSGCTTGAKITIDHGTGTVNNPANISATGTNDVFEFTQSLINSNGTFNKIGASYTQILAPNKPTNSTAWKCHWATPQDNWN